MNLDDYVNKIKEIYEEEGKFSSNKLGDAFNLHAYGSEGAIPHIYYSNKRVSGCIKFLEPKYFCHEKHHDGLSTHEKRQLNDLIHSRDIWKKLIVEWNKDSKQENKLPEDLPIPDYNLLPNLNPVTGKLNKEDRK